MKKKVLSVLLAMATGIFAITGCSSSIGKEDQSAEQTGLANPWTKSDKQGVAEATGFEMTAPEGAAEASYSYMSDGGTAQLSFVLDGMKWTYRMQAAEELTDISGMAYGWTSQEEGTVSGRDAVYYTYSAPDNGTDGDVKVVNWYDGASGVTYSLSVSGKDSDKTDIRAYAELLYTPAQGDAADSPEENYEEELNDYFLGEHKRSEDESTLTISDNGDGTFKVDISITRLCHLENGVGTFADHKMTFEADDPSGEKLSGVIYRDGDNSLVVKITDSTWELLPSDELLEGFGK